jgi:septum formation protein
MSFLLASESERRVELLTMMGYEFSAYASGFPEVSLEEPVQTVETNARGKALAVAEERGGVVLAADTVVYAPWEGRVMGQAANCDEVREMLEILQGGEHEVYTGVAVVGSDGGELEVRSSLTRVRMRGLLEDELSAYAATGEGVGKAGGYAVQGRAAMFVERLDGEYTNVVGLPLSLTGNMLHTRGIRWY